MAHWENPEQPFENGAAGNFRCPMLLISANYQTSNDDYSDVIVLPCNIVDESLPVQLYYTVRPTAENRLPYPMQVEGPVFYTMPKFLLESYLGELSDAEMFHVGEIIKKVLALV